LSELSSEIEILLNWHTNIYQKKQFVTSFAIRERNFAGDDPNDIMPVLDSLIGSTSQTCQRNRLLPETSVWTYK